MRKSLLVAALLVTGCAVPSSLPPKPLVAADLAAMNGYWIGEYVSYQSGKRAAITLTIRSSVDTASGDIVMVPNGARPVVAADVAAHLKHSASPEVLRVAFKRVIGGMVEGQVEEYYSTLCACIVRTTLQGTPSANRIEGEFVTSNSRGVQERGTWSVERHIVAADDLR